MVVVATNAPFNIRMCAIAIIAALLRYGWQGCGTVYPYNASVMNADYGEPEGLCKETAPESGVFTREWSKSTVKMDCNTWEGTITMK